VVALLVIVGVVAIAIAGGFRTRAVPQIDVGVNSEMDAGNLVFRFQSATAQYDPSAIGDPWSVVVTGEVRNPQAAAMTLMSGSPTNLVGVGRPALPNQLRYSYKLGAAGSDAAPSNARQTVPPGNDFVPLQVKFTFAEGFVPGETFPVGVLVMQYTNNTVLGLSEEKNWNPDPLARPMVVRLPCTHLPDATGS